MLDRAILAFLVLPGVFAFAIPAVLARLDPWAKPLKLPGLVPLLVGLALLLWCVRDFYVAGGGTLAPWAPPKNLVVIGLYRWSRNPMYIAVLLLLAGWAALFWSPLLVIYACTVAVAFHLRVVLSEEPWLDQTFGEEWRRYQARAPRWLL